jgi:hypothetical protein
MNSAATNPVVKPGSLISSGAVTMAKMNSCAAGTRPLSIMK